jgi:hypothetical protein
MPEAVEIPSYFVNIAIAALAPFVVVAGSKNLSKDI